MNLDNIFQYHPPTPVKAKAYEKLRGAAKVYAEVLIRDRVEEDDYVDLEIAYEDYVRIINETIPTDSPEYFQAIKYIDDAYDLAIDPKQSIVTTVQAASMFVNAALALSPD